jgi:LPXTG-motif cell wall-anchored protein
VSSTWKAVLLLLLTVPVAFSAPDTDALPQEQRRFGDITVNLAVRVADPPEVPVTLTVTVEGPATLEVGEEGLRLEDPAGGWDPTAQAAEWSGSARRTWQQTVRLQAKKPGPWPVPAVSVRVRPSPEAAWERAEWTDVLGKSRPGPSIEELSPLPSTGTNLWWVVILVVIVLGGSGWLVARRWRRRPAPPLGPRQRALRDLAALSPATPDLIAFHDQLAQVLRAFLAARFGLPAAQRTTAELLTAIAALPEFPADQQAPLRYLLERCDAVRFGGRSDGPEAAQTVLDGARHFIEQIPDAPGR